jgi:AbrB family looped-hinge helix DNA binding protein
MKDNNHKFYGSTTVGERGQVVIPAEARRDLNITQGTKLLVFSGHGGDDLVFTRAESMAEFINKAKEMMTQMEGIINKKEDE